MPDDLEELNSLYEECMRAYTEAFMPWDEHRFKDNFNPDEVEVVERGGQTIGFIITKISDESVYLAEIQLRPEWRNRGIGARLLQLSLSRGKCLGRPVRLRVLRNNPALRLYERFGFRQIGEGACDLLLERES